MAVTKRLRFEIFRRDNHACRYCGAVAPDAELTVDHVIPVALGGTDDPTNLVTSCRDCNTGKTSSSPDSPLVADVSQDALRWAAAIKRATEDAMAERADRVEIEKAVYEVFSDVAVPSYRGGGSASDYLPLDWFNSIRRLVAAGLDRAELIDAAYIAAAARNVRPDNLWRYYCGICWNIVSERQDAAKVLLAEPPPPAERPKAAPAWERYALTQYLHLSWVCDGPKAFG